MKKFVAVAGNIGVGKSTLVELLSVAAVFIPARRPRFRYTKTKSPRMNFLTHTSTPLPLVDEFLILAGTILLSRLAKGAEDAQSATGAGGATGPTRATGAPSATVGQPKHVGRGTTRSP